MRRKSASKPEQRPTGTLQRGAKTTNPPNQDNWDKKTWRQRTCGLHDCCVVGLVPAVEQKLHRQTRQRMDDTTEEELRVQREQFAQNHSQTRNRASLECRGKHATECERNSETKQQHRRNQAESEPTDAPVGHNNVVAAREVHARHLTSLQATSDPNTESRLE
jgi:hypothetical protein